MVLRDTGSLHALLTTQTLPESNMTVTRRKLIIGGAALGMSALLPQKSSASQDQAGASPVAGFPRTLAHFLGETTIPSPPARVVSVSDFVDLDYPLALGVKPVLYGFTNAWNGGTMPWQTDAIDLPMVDKPGEPDLEAIAAAKPDLIFGMETIEPAYEHLSAIAPTIAFRRGAPWRDGLRLAASALGLESLAEERIAETDSLLAATKETLAPIAGKQLMVGVTNLGIFYVWGDQTSAASVFKDLGLNFVGGTEPSLTPLSLEQVNVLESADIILSVNADPIGIETQEASPLFQSLPAVQNGGYDVLSVVQGRALGDGPSPLSLPWILPQFVEVMQRLARGEGKQLS
ncbi:iron-siderophore ABC transporter substrate-binding protein [soil metagenome]